MVKMKLKHGDVDKDNSSMQFVEFVCAVGCIQSKNKSQKWHGKRQDSMLSLLVCVVLCRAVSDVHRRTCFCVYRAVVTYAVATIVVLE